MKKLIPFFMSILMVCSLSACTSSDTAENVTGSSTAAETPSESVSDETAPADISETANTEKTEPSQQQTESAKSTAVVYFSATGSTAKIAEYIADALNADIYEIQPAEPYTSDDLNYNNDSCRANTEMNDDSARPEISGDLSAVTGYDTVFIGHPIWWGTAPRIIQTFMDTYDLSGKNVYTFCTSGGSGIGQSISDLQGYYPNVNIIDGKRFDADDTSDTVKEWLDGLELE